MAKKEDPINRLLGTLNKELNLEKDTSLMPLVELMEVEHNLSAPQADIFKSKANVSLFLGGQGSGKTFLAGCVILARIQNNKDARGMICANTYTQLTQSTLFRVREVFKMYGWDEYNAYTDKGDYTVGVRPPKSFDTSRHNYDKYNSIISFRNGAVVYFGSLDNYKALDGKEVAWAVLDETKDTKEEAIKEVILGRLRQRSSLGYNPLLLITSPAKTKWLSEWFSLEDHELDIRTSIFSDSTYFHKVLDNKEVVIASAYHNAKNLPDDYISNQLKNMSTGMADMLVYGSPFSKSGGEFYKGFDRKKHVSKIAYNPDLPIHLTFDFNVNPYMTACIWQVVKKQESYELRQVDEICLPNPRNNTSATCREFKKRYQGHEAGLFVYGDPAGKHRDTRSTAGYNDYTIIKGELKSFNPVLRIESKAPAVVMRGNFINQIFSQSLYNIDIIISKHCKHTIADYTYLKEAMDGSKHKEKARKDGVSFEKYGHCSDANDYFILSLLKNEFQKYLRGGEKRKTPLFGLFNKNTKR